MNRIRKSVLLYGHLLLSSMGLLAIVVLIVRHMLSSVPNISFQAQLFYPWAAVFTLGKAQSLALHLGTVIGLTVFYLVAYRWLRANQEQIFRQPVFSWLSDSWPRVVGHMALVAILNAIFCVWVGRPFRHASAIIPFWIVVLAFPIMQPKWMTRGPVAVSWWFNYRLLLVVMGVLVILPVASFVKGGLPLENEFPDIAEKTILSDKQIVSNAEYINAHRIGGLVRHDPYKDGAATSHRLSQRGLSVPMTDLLSSWLSYGDRPARLVYDAHTQLLFPLLLSPEEQRQLRALLPADQAKELDARFPPGEQLGEFNRIGGGTQYSETNWDFVNRNRSELVAQSLAGHFFHHHYALAGPISDYLLGRPIDDIHFLYGWLNTIILANLVKLLGGFSLEHYLQATYPFYPVYFFAALAVAWLMFRNTGYVLAVGACALLAWYAMGFENLRFAPGFNPSRHFVDIFTLLFLYRYWSGQGLRYLFLALGVGVFSIFLNKEFGAILFGATVAASILHAAAQKRWRPIFLIGAAGVAGLAAILYQPENPYNTVKYILMGVATPPTSIIINFILGGLLSLLGLLLFATKERGPDWYALLFWTGYAAGLLTYFVWYPSLNHLLSLGVVWALLAALSIRQGSLALNLPAVEMSLVRMMLIASLVGLVPLVGMHWKDRYDYLRTFEAHVTYTWRFPTARFQTTMDPKPFEDSVALIKKYAPGPEIILISKYANIMPWLAGKYNSIPYHELPLELLTLKEVGATVDYLRRRNPRYLFVDTDIWRSKVGDIFNFNDPVTNYLGVWSESRDRAILTQNLQLVARPVLAGYKVIEAGPLLTVYERAPEGSLSQPNHLPTVEKLAMADPDA